MSFERDREKISAFGRAFALTSLGNLALVVAKEMYGPLKDWMSNLTGHHWVTHGLAMTLIFLLGTLVFPARPLLGDSLRRGLIVWCSLGAGGITVFYLIH